MSFGEINENLKVVMSGLIDDDSEFIPIIADEEDDEVLGQFDMPEFLPILPLRNTVLFPGVVIPITVGREKSIKLVKEIYSGSKIIGVLSQLDNKIEDPEGKDLYKVGTIAQIIRILEMPDGSTSVIIQGKKRFAVDEFTTEDPYIQAKVHLIDDIKPELKNKEFDALVDSLRDFSLKIIQLSSNIPPEATFALKNIGNPYFLINFIASNSSVKTEEKQKLLEIDNVTERANLLLEYLNKEVQMLELKNDIQTKVKADLDKQQREFLLNQQMKTIQDELGGNPMDKEIEDLKIKGKKKTWNKEVASVFNREVDKLIRMNPATGEYSVQLNYVQTLLDLPWNEYTKDNFDLRRAQKILDDDHFGLEKVKERILEHLAVLKFKISNNMLVRSSGSWKNILRKKYCKSN
jgi:ATP-dependent Lon protease